MMCLSVGGLGNLCLLIKSEEEREKDEEMLPIGISLAVGMDPRPVSEGSLTSIKSNDLGEVLSNLFNSVLVIIF
jgi:hypothetical protein